MFGPIFVTVPLTLENYYITKPEPYQSCLLALRQLVLSAHPEIIHARLFQIPFFFYKGKKLGYLWLNKRKLMLGFCLDKSLQEPVTGVRPKDIYESFQIDPESDLPVEYILGKLNSYLDRINSAERR